jgi:RNA polymerase primary sigma factor
MDRTGVKPKTIRRQRPRVTETRRDKPGRRAGRSGHATKGAERSLPRPANDTELELTPTGSLGGDTREIMTAGAVEFAEPIEAVAEAAVGLPEATPFVDEIELAVAAVTGETELAAGADEEDEDEDEEPAPARDEFTADAEEEGPAPGKREEEPQSFLAMYFRDMAELDVLRPEQEFETARKIEELELELWRTLLTFTAGAGWIADTIEKAVGKPVPELKVYRALAERTKRRSAAAVRSRFDKLVTQVATRLKEQDIDRLFVDAVITEVLRVKRALRTGMALENLAPIESNPKAFREFVDNAMRRTARVKQAKNEFVKANLRLVVSIARRFNHGRLPLPDLIQEGNIGLMKAVERYDYRRGFRFSTYASWWIRHAISRALADKGRAVRLPVHMIDAYHRIAKSERELQSKLERPATTEEIASATGIESDKLEKMKTFLSETPVSLDRPISDEDGRRLIDVLVDPNEGPSPPDQMMTSETQREMLKLLGGLKPIEADILRKRFGLVNDRERTLKEIGDEYHLSRERVRQLQEQALGKMRKAMAKREIL